MILKYSGALWVAVAAESQESEEIAEEEFTRLRRLRITAGAAGKVWLCSSQGGTK